MLDFILLILACVGMSHIVADSSIFGTLKYRLIYKDDFAKEKRFAGTRWEVFFDKIVEMMNCYQCNGFWCGGIVYTLYYFNAWFFLWAFTISLISLPIKGVCIYVTNLASEEDAVDEE